MIVRGRAGHDVREGDHGPLGITESRGFLPETAEAYDKAVRALTALRHKHIGIADLERAAELLPSLAALA
jgi:hypothetical protein